MTDVSGCRRYIVGTFWKELLFYLTQALFQRYTGYTGTSLYEQWSLSMFNTLFTSLPVIFLGIFEQDLAPATLLAVPELYSKGRRSEGFNFRVYFAWMFMAASESVVVVWVMLGLYGRAVFTTGQDLFSMGVLSYSACVILINAKLQLLEQRYKTVIALICLILQIGGWFLWNIIFSATYTDNQEMMVRAGFVARFGQNGLWWFALILGVSATVLFELAVRAGKCAVWPTDTEGFQELEKDGVVRRRFEEASEMELRAGWEVERGGSSEWLMRAAERRTDDVVVVGEGKVGGRGKDGMEVEEGVVAGAERVGSVADVHEVFAKGFGEVRR